MAIERTSDLEERSEQNIHTTVGKKKKKVEDTETNV